MQEKTNKQTKKHHDICFFTFFFYFLWIFIWHWSLLCAESLPFPSGPQRETGDVWCLPPVWTLGAVIWFHFAVSSLVHLPSPVTLSILSFSACWSFLLNFFQKILQYFLLRDRLFCMTRVKQLGEVSWSVVCAACCHMALVFAVMHIYDIFYFFLLHLSIPFLYFL